MNSYQKYLSGHKAKSFNNSISVLNAGYNDIEKFQHYPSKTHPSSYYFSWDTGRILSEYQIIYITRGEGIFESESSRILPVKAGSIIILYPNEWHRFKPDINSGWEEYWVGCHGILMDFIKQQAYISQKNPIIKIGKQQSIIMLFKEIVDTVKNEEEGFQLLASGATLHLLGMIQKINKQQTNNNLTASIDKLILQAISLIKDNLNINLRPEEISKGLLISYSLFRRHFKLQTGLSPKQYVLDLLMERAKELLADKSLNINQIALLLGFNNSFHFSKIFKTKVGLSPSEYKKTLSDQAYIT